MELFTPEETAETEAGLIGDGAHLRALSLERLGYYGGRNKPLPVAIGNQFLDDDNWYWDDLYSKDETRRAADLREAQLLAGMLWRGCARLLDGLFDDLRVIGELEADDGDVVDFIENESSVMRMLPPAFVEDYDAYFVQRFLIIAADMTTKLAGTWSSPSCVAQELAVRCLVGVTDLLLDEYDIALEPGWGGGVFDALLEDADYEFLYDITSVGRREALLRMGTVDTINLGFNSWFEPFGDRAMSAFANPAPPAPCKPEPAEYAVDGEAFPGPSRQRALDDGALVDLVDFLEEGPFGCPVAITQEALQAVTGPGGPAPECDEWYDRQSAMIGAILDAAAATITEDPDRISTRFTVDRTEPRGGEPVALTLVAGPDGAGGQHLTIQLAPR